MSAHLYWQDALRAESISRLYGLWATSFIGATMQASLAFAQALRTAHEPAAADAVAHWMPVAGLVAIVPAVLSLAREGTGIHWFRKRLWPTLAPGQVLVPGQDLPERVA